jgi:hypothetical protein
MFFYPAHGFVFVPAAHEGAHQRTCIMRSASCDHAVIRIMRSCDQAIYGI